MERNKEWNGTRSGMEQGREWNIFVIWNGTRQRMWNGTDVGWCAECECVISCAYSLTYDFHMGRVEWNYELDID